MADTPEFARLPDLAARQLGASVVAANDEFFAAKENLIGAAPAKFRPHTFGHRGQVYDGWETRRRREPGHDWAVVRLGVAGVIHGVVVDTSTFTGNFPARASVDAAWLPGYPSIEEVLDEQVKWTPLLPPSPLAGDTANFFSVSPGQRFSHVRLNIHPDGGVARLRVHGSVVADPSWFDDMPLDLACVVNGGTIMDCSNAFYSTPGNLLLPGEARVMGEGWETARRRDDGNDWVRVQLAEEGLVRQVEVDTTHFIGNAPGWFRLTGYPDAQPPVELIGRTGLQPDTRQRFRVTDAAPVRQVRLDIYPDGGLARLRVFGELTARGRDRMQTIWHETA